MDSMEQELEGFTWEVYYKLRESLLKFDDYQVDTELRNQAAVYSYYHSLMCIAKRKLEEEDMTLEHFISSTRKEAKNNMSFPGKKMTAKDLDDLVLSADDYKEYKTNLNDATLKYELLKGLVRSLEHRKDMLQQISANKREETKLYK